MKREHTSNELALYPISPRKHDSQMEINLPSVFAAGEIAAGFAEVAIAVKSTVEYIRPARRWVFVSRPLSVIFCKRQKTTDK